jgi:16S rRNA (guanine(966)-N(2))-methyltransferase RsmD
MTLRITGGSFRNISIKAPKGPFVRPTTSIIRQAVFNICNQKIKRSCFLDICAGSGIMGIEALSRGSSFCSFIDSNKIAVSFIRDNLKKMDLTSLSEVISYDAIKAVKFLTQTYDIIYIDAPYKLYDTPALFLFPLIEKLINSNLLKKNADLFIEEGFYKSKKDEPYSLKSLIHKSSRKYGGSLLHHYISE